jgi:hypothetical protein
LSDAQDHSAPTELSEGARSPRAVPGALPGTVRRGPRLWIPVLALVVAGALPFLLAVGRADVKISGTDEFERAAYCSVAGNTAPDGSELAPGTFLDLLLGEPGRDGRVAGAQPANFIQGSGLTCAGPPSGFVRRGFASSADNVRAGIYPYYAPEGS